MTDAPEQPVGHTAGLRDQFAMAALTGLLAGAYGNTTRYNAGEVPREAFLIADAMQVAFAIRQAITKATS